MISHLGQCRAIEESHVSLIPQSGSAHCEKKIRRSRNSVMESTDIINSPTKKRPNGYPSHVNESSNSNGES
jgi:hypothetical protein